MARFDADLRQLKLIRLDALLARARLAALSVARYNYAMLDRQIALARCVAMIRLYAGAHDGKLPASLADVENVVEPIDPVTGQPFDYQVVDDRAIIEAPAPIGKSADTGYLYEIRIAQP